MIGSIDHAERLRAWKDQRILVVGDVILDKYVYGRATRISPEAPVPVFNIEEEYCTLGGAGNVAENMAMLGGQAALVGVVGNDIEGNLLIARIKENCISWYGCVDTGRPTTLKVRICTEQQQLLRIDREDASDVSSQVQQSIIESIDRGCLNFSPAAIVVSDYNKGVVTNDTMCHLVDRARKLRIPILVDPKGDDLTKYNGVTLIKPNLKEAEALLKWKLNSRELIMKAATELCCRTGATWAMITLGKDGLVIGSVTDSFFVPAVYREVFDITGAGDAVMAATALALTTDADPVWVGTVAVHAGSVAVGQKGTHPISFDALVASIGEKRLEHSHSKLLIIGELQTVVDNLRRQGKRIVFTNGCFDLFHYGHAKLLKEAKSLGDILIVTVNSDASISSIKGASRPIMSLAERLAVLEAIKWVDFVIVFEEDTPEELIKLICPDVLVKGNDYSMEQVVGANFVKSYGGSVVLVELEQGISTSQILKRIEGRYRLPAQIL